MAFKILITERKSAVGAGLLSLFEDYEHSISCPDIPVQGWCDESKLKAILLKAEPAVLINTLQFSNPEFTQENPLFHQVLAKLCLELDITVIHLSSHEVFSVGQQSAKAMAESDIPLPDSVLGCSLLAAEKAFLENPRCIVLRLPWLVDLSGGILEQVCQRLVYAGGIEASESWKGCLTTIDDVLRVIVAIMQQILCDSDNWGIAHVRTSDSCSEVEFADYVARALAKIGCPVGAVRCVTNEQRFILSNGWLAGALCTDGFGIQFRSWRQGIKARVKNWLKEEVAQGRVLLEDSVTLTRK